MSFNKAYFGTGAVSFNGANFGDGDVNFSDAFIEGSLASQSKKLADGFSHHYWIDARTCIIS